MDPRAAGNAFRTSAMWLALAALAACTTTVPLAQDYRGPDARPADDSAAAATLLPPLRVTGDVETRERAHFVVRQMSLPSSVDSSQSIDFEYYDVEGDQRTPVVLLLPVFNEQLGIPRAFARYFANQGWAAVVAVRGRDPLTTLVAPTETVQGNLQDYRRILDWVEIEPELDASRIGVFGVSLGAMDAVMLTALDRRVNSLVIAMAGGDLSARRAHDRRHGGQPRNEPRGAGREARCRGQARSVGARAVRRRGASAHGHHARRRHHSVRSAAAVASGARLSRNDVSRHRAPYLGGVLPESS
jgi:hypothetical protein